VFNLFAFCAVVSAWAIFCLLPLFGHFRNRSADTLVGSNFKPKKYITTDNNAALIGPLYPAATRVPRTVIAHTPMIVSTLFLVIAGE
jgi:hypothetical protein